MSDDDLTDHIPLKYGEDMYITQYDAHGVESNGLLKMDFLGLRNLTFVQRMKEAALEKYGVAIDISKINLEDTATLQLFAAGRTKGIFQFEQAGAINLLKRVQPVQFEEIVATTSLNRPGWPRKGRNAGSNFGGYFTTNLWYYALSRAGNASSTTIWRFFSWES